MSAVIDGKKCAAGLIEQIADDVRSLVLAGFPRPGLAVVLIGADPASQVYVRNKIKQVEGAGLHSEEYRLPADVVQEELLVLIERLNSEPRIHGILVQLPLPNQIDEATVINAISVVKDVDGFHVLNTGLLSLGTPRIVPCTPKGCMMLLKKHREDIGGLNAVVVGRSNIVGKPMAILLLQENCTVTIAHSRTRDLPELCRTADILVAAVGRPEIIKGEWIKPGAIVIDVGINRIQDNDRSYLVGDVDFESAKTVAGAITPVPGGVGPMTIACLLANTVAAARLQYR